MAVGWGVEQVYVHVVADNTGAKVGAGGEEWHSSIDFQKAEIIDLAVEALSPGLSHQPAR